MSDRFWILGLILIAVLALFLCAIRAKRTRAKELQESDDEERRLRREAIAKGQIFVRQPQGFLYKRDHDA